MSADRKREVKHEPVIEVEVERLPPRGFAARDGGPAARGTPSQVREISGVIGPVLAGFLIDVLDAVTVAPPLGLVLGWPLGYYILRQAGLSPKRAFSWGALVGIYCAVPMTMLLPVATLLGVGVRVSQILARNKSNS